MCLLFFMQEVEICFANSPALLVVKLFIVIVYFIKLDLILSISASGVQLYDTHI